MPMKWKMHGHEMENAWAWNEFVRVTMEKQINSLHLPQNCSDYDRMQG